MDLVKVAKVSVAGAALSVMGGGALIGQADDMVDYRGAERGSEQRANKTVDDLDGAPGSEQLEGKGGDLTLDRGKAVPSRGVADLAKPPVTKEPGPVAAVEGFADALVWSLSAEVDEEEAQLIPGQMGGRLNAADAAMLIGFDRSQDVHLDLSQAAYRVLGYSGTEKNPNQVMVEIVASLEVDGQAQRLIAGGVMLRTATGWVPTSLRPREMGSKPEMADEEMVIAQVESGDLGIGWQTFAEADE